ncbi:microtubule-associated protein Jupiter [Anopheles ziemanni]|uniref:microtubule-associated protein Jupiter n=1 Tax=Anopheles coustani TaxID=139045 RepID=UPI002659A8E5|nr:microtubule-associated protein Jupiter [Anopheles coustani]XP_058174558.1 microtubule-associated protein Jupiter [Anopheles ziemanni]
MATYAAFKHVELYNVGNTKKRVLKPPGGGSSDLFGAEHLAPSTPRTMSKNRMQSNIFATPADAHKNVFRQGVHRYYFLGTETPRRTQGQDSHNRLFGEVNRPFTPAKNHMKSNLPIGNGQDHPDAGSKQHTNGKANGVAHQNGNGTANGHGNGHSNGHSNGNGHISSASSDNGSSHIFLRRLSNEDASPDSAYSSGQQSHSQQPVAGPGGIWAPFDGLPLPPLSPRRQLQFYPSGEALNPTYASNINLCISDDIIISVTEHDDASASVLQSYGKASPRSPRSPRFAQRNPVTGNGIEDYGDKPRKPSSRRGGAGGDGNPVTGEGYSKSNGAAEINTTVPSLNGGGHVINKNRIPPGGFSSGLW